jgi:polyphosphate kinase
MVTEWQPIVHQRSRMIGALPTKSRDAFETAADILVNRELSWLDLNARVLDLAADGEQPLLERAKFCAIFSSNLDEFFMVRVAALLDQVHAGLGVLSPDGRTAGDRPRRRVRARSGLRA